MAPKDVEFAIMAGHSNPNNKLPGISEQGIKELCAIHEHPQDQASIAACCEAREKERGRQLKTIDVHEQAARIC